MTTTGSLGGVGSGWHGRRGVDPTDQKVWCSNHQKQKKLHKLLHIESCRRLGIVHYGNK